MSAASVAPPRKDVRALERVLGRLARADAAPWLHQEVARRLAEHLSVIREPPRIWLDWWGFLGGGGAAVAALWPDAQRLVAEPTAALLGRSREALRAPWWALARRDDAQRRVLAVDAVADASVQMVWANMMLHWVPDEQATIARWQRALAPAGCLMFSTLGPQTLRELREVYAQAGWPAPHVPFIDMHDLGDMLLHAGFVDPVTDQETITLTWSSARSALADLRAWGGNAAPDRAAGLLTPRWRDRLEAALAARAGGDGRIAIGFEIVYGHAIKGRLNPDDSETAKARRILVRRRRDL